MSASSGTMVEWFSLMMMLYIILFSLMMMLYNIIFMSMKECCVGVIYEKGRKIDRKINQNGN